MEPICYRVINRLTKLSPPPQREVPLEQINELLEGLSKWSSGVARSSKEACMNADTPLQAPFSNAAASPSCASQAPPVDDPCGL